MLYNDDRLSHINEFIVNHKNEIEKFIKLLSHKYGIDYKLMSDAVLYELSLLFNSKDSSNSRVFRRSSLKDIFILFSILLYLLLLLPFSYLLTFFVQKKQFDVIYEEMWDKDSWYKRFYRYVDKYLVGIKKGIIFTSVNTKKTSNIKNIENIDEFKGEVLDTRSRNQIYAFHAIFWVLKKEVLYIKKLITIAKRSEINLIFLNLRIIRRLLMYKSQISNIESKVLVSAGDYYWSPLKYLMYKEHIKNILLIQHNYKGEALLNSLLLMSDVYFAHSRSSVNKLIGMDKTEKIPCGSIQLSPYLSNIDSDTEYDILLVSQTVYDQNLVTVKQRNNFDQAKLINAYKKLLENLSQYLLSKNGSIRVVCVTKPSYYNDKSFVLVKEYLGKNKNVSFVKAYGPDVFKLIKKSKLIINMYSSLGFEAYGLDKKVLWINYDHCTDAMGFDTEQEDLHILIKDSRYKAFEMRVNLLLSDSIEVSRHYEKLKVKYMNVKENPGKVVADKIKELLEELEC